MRKIFILTALIALAVPASATRAEAASTLTMKRAAAEAADVAEQLAVGAGADDWGSSPAPNCIRRNMRQVKCGVWVYYSDIDQTCYDTVLISRLRDGRVRRTFPNAKPNCGSGTGEY
jgi:hypothetical protein